MLQALVLRSFLGAALLAVLGGAVPARAEDEEPQERADEGPASGTSLERDVELDWGAIEGAVTYEVEVTRLVDGVPQKNPFHTTAQSHKFKNRFPPGRYRLKARSVDGRGVPGAWSEPIPFEIPYPPVPTKTPARDAVIQSKSATKDTVAFQWQPILPDLRYRLEVFVKGNDVPVAKTEVKGNKASMKLPVAKAYTWRAVPLDEGKPIGDPPSVGSSFELKGKALGKPALQKRYDPDDRYVEWTSPKFAESYHVKLTVQDPRSKKKKTLFEKKGLKEPELEIRRAWPLGRYRVEVASEAAYRAPSQKLSYEFERDLSEDKRIVRPTLFLRVGMAPTLLQTTTTGFEPEPSLRAVIFSAYDLLGRWGFRNFAVELGHSLRQTTLFENGAEGGGDVRQPPLEFDATRTYAAFTYFIPIGGIIAVEPFVGFARRTFLLLLPTDERTLTLDRNLAPALMLGSDLTLRATSHLGLRGRAFYEQLWATKESVKSARFVNAEGTVVAAIGNTGFTLAGGYSLSVGDVRIANTATGEDGRMREIQHALLLALAFSY